MAIGGRREERRACRNKTRTRNGALRPIVPAKIARCIAGCRSPKRRVAAASSPPSLPPSLPSLPPASAAASTGTSLTSRKCKVQGYTSGEVNSSSIKGVTNCVIEIRPDGIWRAASYRVIGTLLIIAARMSADAVSRRCHRSAFTVFPSLSLSLSLVAVAGRFVTRRCSCRAFYCAADKC